MVTLINIFFYKNALNDQIDWPSKFGEASLREVFNLIN